MQHINRRTQIIILFISISLFLTAAPVYGWSICNTLNSGDWSDPTNWDCGHVPGSTDFARIVSTHTVTSSGTNTVDTLDNDGTLTNSGTITVEALSNNGTITNICGGTISYTVKMGNNPVDDLTPCTPPPVGGGNNPGSSNTGGRPFVPVRPDHRINWMYGDLYGVAYVEQDAAGNPALHVYCIDADTGNSSLGMVVTEADVEAFTDPPAANTLIQESAVCNLSFYVLATGEYQLNIGPDPRDWTTWVLISDGLDFDSTYSYKIHGR